MCRSIKRLRPKLNEEAWRATDEEIEEAARQFVRKISGFQRPSPANEGVFEAAVDDIGQASRTLLDSLRVGART
jgi:hypothetical protein